MATTAAGTPYVESTDTASAYPTTSLALAQRVDAVEDKILYSGLHLSGTTGNYASAADAAALDITGDIELIACVALTNWTNPAGVQGIISKWDTTSTKAYALYSNTVGKLGIAFSTNGTTTTLVDSDTAHGIPDGTLKWIKATRVSSSGVCKFYTSNDGVTWTQNGGNVTGASGSINSNASTMHIGAIYLGTTWPMTGTVYRALVKSGIDGTTVADADFRLPWPSRHLDSAGNTWTLNGSAWAWKIGATA